jgi:hypothetical protein
LIKGSAGLLARSARTDDPSAMATTKKKADTKPKATPAAAAAPVQSETPPLNREQRRAQKFGKAGKVHEHVPGDPWPESGANPAFGRGGDDQAAYAGRPDQDVTRETGPGTGGATEQKGQRPQHEGAHAGQSTKG